MVCTDDRTSRLLGRAEISAFWRDSCLCNNHPSKSERLLKANWDWEICGGGLFFISPLLLQIWFRKRMSKHYITWHKLWAVNKVLYSNNLNHFRRVHVYISCTSCLVYCPSSTYGNTLQNCECTVDVLELMSIVFRIPILWKPMLFQKNKSLFFCVAHNVVYLFLFILFYLFV